MMTSELWIDPWVSLDAIGGHLSDERHNSSRYTDPSFSYQIFAKRIPECIYIFCLSVRQAIFKTNFVIDIAKNCQQ